MPTVSVYADEIESILGAHVGEKEFDKLCFDFGLELDDVTSEYEMFKKEQGAMFTEASAAGKSKRVVYKVDVPANRHDILSLEGLTTALKVFRGDCKPPQLVLDPPTPSQSTKIVVMPDTGKIRPYVVGAILRGVSFTPGRYESFIELQDKLHHNICRKRTLVAMGTHDFERMQGPFVYDARAPSATKFVPLNCSEEMDGPEMMKYFAQHQQLKHYLHIIKDSDYFPGIYEESGKLVSFPPIINSEQSKISLHTRDVFIECTATDLTKAETVLNILISSFSQYCDKPYTVEPVQVEYHKDHPSEMAGKTVVYPNIEERVMVSDPLKLRKALALEDKLTDQDVVEMLTKMYLPSSLVDGALHVRVPPVRADVMHECDLVEDIAIVYGFNNIEARVPSTVSWPKEQPLNHLSDMMRGECAMAGYNECLAFTLCSIKENYNFLRLGDDFETPRLGGQAPRAKDGSVGMALPHLNFPVYLSNPATRDFEIVRSSLLPSLLQTLKSNKHNPTPLRLFEVSDVVLQDSTAKTGARNERRVAALIAGQTSGFESVNGLMNQVMWALNARMEEVEPEENGRTSYFLESSSALPQFFPGRSALIQARVPSTGEVLSIGQIGVLHPEVLSNYDIPFAVSAFEITLEPFVKWL